MRILAALLSIVMPRLGQIFNRQIIKGFVYLLAEHVVNTITHINRAIYLGFNGHQQASIDVLNHQLALFIPLFIISASGMLFQMLCLMLTDKRPFSLSLEV